MRLTEMLDIKKQIADLEKSNLEDARRIEDEMVNETITGMKKRADEHRKLWDSIEDTAHDTFVSIFKSGKSAFDRLRDALKNGLYDLLYQMTIKKWIINISAAVSGGASGSAAASLLPGGSSGGGSFGAMKSVFDVFSSGFDGANNAFIGSISDFGASVADLGGMFGDIGGWIGANSTILANVAPFVPSIISLLQGDVKGAIASGIGAGIGFAIGGPVGGAIGSALGSLVGGLFGGKVGKPDSLTTATLSLSGVSSITKLMQNDGGKAAPFKDMATGIADNFTKLVTGLGGDLKRYDGDNSLGAKKSEYWTSQDMANFGVRVRENMLEVLVNTPYGHLGGGSFVNGKDSDAVAENVNAAYVNALKAFTDLPDYIMKLVDDFEITKKAKAGDANSATTFLNFLAGLKSLHDAMDVMPPLFDKLKLAVDGITNPAALNAVNAQVSALSAFYSLFYSQQEQFDFSVSQLQKAFTGLNLAMPNSRDAYRALVEGVDTTTQSGLDLFNALVSLAPSMDAYYKALQDQKAIIDEIVLSTDNYKTLVDFTRAQRYVENGISLNNLPSYDVGSSYIPSDQTANIHQGERIFTRTENADIVAAVQASNNNYGAMVKELREMRSENQRHAVAMIQATQKTAKLLDKFDNEGMPLSETDRSGERIVLDTRTVP
jgi:hypothetical protein